MGTISLFIQENELILATSIDGLGGIHDSVGQLHAYFSVYC